MSVDTFMSVEYKEEYQWKRIHHYHFWYSTLPDVLTTIMEGRSKSTHSIVSNAEIRKRLPEDISQETLADVPTVLLQGSIEVGWLMLRELIMFDWNATYRQYPLYRDTCADAVGEYFLNGIVGKLFETYDPDRVRLVYWVLA